MIKIVVNILSITEKMKFGRLKITVASKTQGCTCSILVLILLCIQNCVAVGQTNENACVQDPYDVEERYDCSFYADGLWYSVVDKSNPMAVVVHNRPSWEKYQQDSIIIPSTVMCDSVSYMVVGIEFCAFCRCPNLRYVELPNSMIYVSHCAFNYSLKLENIVLNKGLRYASRTAFIDCESLKEVIFPIDCNILELNTSTPFYCPRFYYIGYDGEKWLIDQGPSGDLP